MRELVNIQQDGGKVEAALEAHRTALGGHEVEFLVEVLHHPDHEPRHIPAKRDATLLEVLDESARKLDVKLLPNPHTPLDRLHGVYEHRRVGEALDLDLTVSQAGPGVASTTTTVVVTAGTQMLR